MDFAALPPELNSARIYTGPGPGPLLAAAAAWNTLAAGLADSAAQYAATIAELDAAWRGPSAAAMSAAATTNISWLTGTATAAATAGAQAAAAAAAFEAAFAATVPPPVVAANRALLAALVATNILGINTPAIMATEMHYVEMWAQDAAAMYGYAAASAQAAVLAPFTPAPQTTNPAATAATPAAAAAGSIGTIIPSLLQNLTSPASSGALAAADPSIGGIPLLDLIVGSGFLAWVATGLASTATGVVSDLEEFVQDYLLYQVTTGSEEREPDDPVYVPDTTSPEVRATVGAASRLEGGSNGMSVPPVWGQAARPVAAAEPGTPTAAVPAARIRTADEVAARQVVTRTPAGG